MEYEQSTQFIVTTVVTLLICAFGLLGNMFCAVVLFNRHMTRTSYIYILQGLTISDICLLTRSFLKTLQNLGVIGQSNNVYFSTALFFWDWISTSGTKYFTVAISLERFFVVTFPLKAHALLTTSRAKGTACGVFWFCVLLSCFSYIYINWIDFNSFHIYVAIVLHFVPFILVVVFNVLVFLGLRGRAIRKSSTAKDEDYSATRMLFGIMLVFGICYSFEFIRRTMNFLWPEYMKSNNYHDYVINCLADIFYVLNSSVNFVVYCLLGKKFRQVFCKIFEIGAKNTNSDNANVKRNSEDCGDCEGGSGGRCNGGGGSDGECNGGGGSSGGLNVGRCSGGVAKSFNSHTDSGIGSFGCNSMEDCFLSNKQKDLGKSMEDDINEI